MPAAFVLSLNWGALRGSNPSPPVPQTSALPNELKAPYAMTSRRRSKPSSVRDDHLSQPIGLATSSPSWLLSTSDLGEQPASGRIGDCCGEDCPFQPVPTNRFGNGFCCSHAEACLSGLSTRQNRAALAFTRHPCSVQLGLSSGSRMGSSGHPQLTVVQFACQRAGIEFDPVPRGRFELPRGYPHYALNVARLPVPPHRQEVQPACWEPTCGLEPQTCCLRNSCSTN